MCITTINIRKNSRVTEINTELSGSMRICCFYAEQPATREPAPYEGRLKTTLTPDNWAEIMEPHFIKWEGAPAGQDIWRKLDLVLEVRSFTGKLGIRDA